MHSCRLSNLGKSRDTLKQSVDSFKAGEQDAKDGGIRDASALFEEILSSVSKHLALFSVDCINRVLFYYLPQVRKLVVFDAHILHELSSGMAHLKNSVIKPTLSV